MNKGRGRGEAKRGRGTPHNWDSTSKVAAHVGFTSQRLGIVCHELLQFIAEGNLWGRTTSSMVG